MATLAQIQEAARLKRAGTPLSEAVSTVRTATTPQPQTTLGQAQAIRDANGGTLRDAVAKVEGNVGTQNVPTNNPGINSAIQAGGEIQKQQYQQGMAQGMNSVDYTQKGVNGETFQVAPVNPQTGLSQPTATPEKTTTVAGVDKAVDIKAQNEAQMALNAQKSQLAIQERKQAEADAKLASIPTDQKGITQSLISGMSVAPQNTQAYRNAVAVSEQFKKFNGMTDVQLLDNLKQGQIGTELDSLLSQNPNFIKAKAELAKFQKTASINRATQIASNVISGKETPVEDDLSKIESKYTPPPGTNYDAYQAYVVQNPDVVSAGLQVKALNDQVLEATKLYSDALKSIKKQYGDMPASALLTLMGSRTNDTKEVLDNLINLKSMAKGDFDLAMKKAEGSYEAYGKDLANQQEIAKEQRTMKNSLALSQMQFDQKIAQQAQAMNDPTQAINSVIDEYAKQGIFASTSAQQHIASFKEQNAKYGTTLGEYISQMQKDFQNKDSYKNKFAPKVSYQAFGDNVYRQNPDGSLTKTDISAKSSTATSDWAKLDDTTLYNQRTGELKKVSASESSQYGVSSADVSPESIKAISSRLSGNNVQCGMVSNDWMAQKFPGAKRMGDSYESKVASVESIGVSDVPQVGGVFAMNTYNSNGHTGIVQSVDLAKGTFTATDANRAGSQNGGPVTTSTYKISDNFTFSKGPAGVGQATPANIEYFNSATATDKKKLQSNPQYVDFQNAKNTVMVDPNADIYDVMKYSQGGKDMGEERLKSLGKFSQGLSQVAELSKKVQETSTGPIIGRLRSYNPYDANAQALLAEINSVIPNIARGVYGEVGVLTDADIQNYAKTLPNIKSTEDTNKLVLAMTLKTMLNGFKGQIQIDGSAGRDVSGFAGTVKQYEDRISQLLSQLGGVSNTGDGNSSIPPNVYSGFESDYANL